MVRAFWEGATRPSAPAAVGILLVAGTLILSAVLLVTPRTLARVDIGYLMADDYDSRAALTGRVMRLRYEGIPEGAVLLLGTSALHHALGESEEFGPVVEGEVGRPVAVRPLYADALNIYLASNVLGAIGEPMDGVVVLSLSAMSFTRSDTLAERLSEDPEVPFVSDPFREEVELAGFEAPVGGGVYFLDHVRFFTARLRAVMNVVRGPRELAARYHVAPVLPDPSRWRRVMDVMTGLLEQYDDHADEVFGVLERVIRMAREKGDVAFVVLEPPINPRAVEEMNAGGVLDRHAARMERFAAEQGIEYWRAREDVELAEEDFADWTHLVRSPSRDRYMAYVAERVARLVERRAREEGS